MLIEETLIDSIAVDAAHNLLVRRATYTVRDGVRLPPPRYHRCAYAPHADLTHEDVRVQRLAAAAWADIPKETPDGEL